MKKNKYYQSAIVFFIAAFFCGSFSIYLAKSDYYGIAGATGSAGGAIGLGIITSSLIICGAFFLNKYFDSRTSKGDL
jgi:hypothetical protein